MLEYENAKGLWNLVRNGDKVSGFDRYQRIFIAASFIAAGDPMFRELNPARARNLNG